MKKRLFKVGLFGFGISLILISIKDTIEGKFLAVLAAIIFIYILIGSYSLFTKD